MHFLPISAWTVGDVAVFALIITIFSIGLVLYVVGVVRHWAKLRAEENKRRREEAIRIVRETAPELAHSGRELPIFVILWPTQMPSGRNSSALPT